MPDQTLTGDTCFITRLRKSGFMVYISHLDCVRLLYRALRRAELPFARTQGFTARPKIKFGPALKLGQEGEFEATFFLTRGISLDEFRERLSRQLPPGITICDIKPCRVSRNQ